MLGRYEGMLFNYETSNRTDFQNGEILPITKTTPRQKPHSRARPSAPPPKDLHTMSERKAYVPFDSQWKAKDILRTNPLIVQQRYVKPVDEGWEYAKNTRPRLVMTPAESMDDISEPKLRKRLIEDFYTSAAHRSMIEALPDGFSVTMRAPIPGLLAPAVPIALEKYKPPYVPAEWRMDSVSWDGRQLRSFCEPNKEFYLSITPKCSACDVTARLQVHKKNNKT